MVQGTGDDEAAADGEDDKAAWLVSLKKRIDLFLDILPDELQPMKRVGSLVKNPLFRFLEREVSVLSRLLKTVHGDLADIRQVCIGEKKSTAQIKHLAKKLHADVVPDSWKKYVVLQSMTAAEWVRDFAKRVEQAIKLSN